MIGYCVLVMWLLHLISNVFIELPFNLGTLPLSIVLYSYVAYLVSFPKIYFLIILFSLVDSLFVKIPFLSYLLSMLISSYLLRLVFDRLSVKSVNNFWFFCVLHALSFSLIKILLFSLLGYNFFWNLWVVSTMKYVFVAALLGPLFYKFINGWLDSYDVQLENQDHFEVLGN